MSDYLENLTKEKRRSLIIDLIKSAIDDGSDEVINFCFDDFECPPLMLACYYGHTYLVKLLLENKNIRVNETSFNRYTALQALFCDLDEEYSNEPNFVETRCDVVRLLFEDPRCNPCITTDNDSTILHVSCQTKCDVKLTKMILDDGRIDINAVNNQQDSALINACDNGSIDKIKLLFDYPNIDLNIQDSLGKTAFYHACQHNYTDIIKLLLEDSRMDPNIQDNDGRTAFFRLCTDSIDDIEIIKLLMNDPRVDVNIANNSGLTAYAACLKNILLSPDHLLEENIEVTDLLRNCGRVDHHGIEHLGVALNDQIQSLKRLLKYYDRKDLIYILNEKI